MCTYTFFLLSSFTFSMIASTIWSETWLTCVPPRIVQMEFTKLTCVYIYRYIHILYYTMPYYTVICYIKLITYTVLYYAIVGTRLATMTFRSMVHRYP